LPQLCLEAGASFLERVEHVVESGKSWTSLGLALTDLFDDLALLAFDGFQFVGKTLSWSGSFLIADARFWRTCRATSSKTPIPKNAGARHDGTWSSIPRRRMVFWLEQQAPPRPSIGRCFLWLVQL
jgi:hypothetical protein